MVRRPRLSLFLSLPLVIVLPALGQEPADPYAGEYELRTVANPLETLVTISVQPRDGSTYAVRRVQITGGTRRAWSGEGTVQGGQLRVTFTSPGGGAARRLDLSAEGEGRTPCGTWTVRSGGLIEGSFGADGERDREVGARQGSAEPYREHSDSIWRLSDGARLRFVLRLNLGSQLQLQGKHAEAIESYTRAIQLAPRQAQAWLARARARSRVRSDQEAIEDYIVALVLSHDPKTAGQARQGLVALLARRKV